jgi:hypothetical protein
VDLSKPIRSVIPMSHGDVLAVLARTDRPLSGRRVAELTDGRLSQTGANLALRALVRAGLVLVEAQPPANLYRLNRQHLAAPSIEALVALREQLIAAMIEHIGSWEIHTEGAWLFGSAARGEGDEASDIDVLVLRPDPVDEGVWDAQVERFAAAVKAWTGNRCAVVEYTSPEFTELMGRADDRLTVALRSDAVALTSRPLPRRTSPLANR